MQPTSCGQRQCTDEAASRHFLFILNTTSSNFQLPQNCFRHIYGRLCTRTRINICTKGNPPQSCEFLCNPCVQKQRELFIHGQILLNISLRVSVPRFTVCLSLRLSVCLSASLNLCLYLQQCVYIYIYINLCVRISVFLQFTYTL